MLHRGQYHGLATPVSRMIKHAHSNVSKYREILPAKYRELLPIDSIALHICALIYKLHAAFRKVYESFGFKGMRIWHNTCIWAEFTFRC